MTQRQATQPVTLVDRGGNLGRPRILPLFAAFALALALIPGCRLRRTTPDESSAPAAERPLRAAPQPVDTTLPTGPTSAPAVLLLVGFAEDAGFAAIRDSKQEARWLREALGDADDPFGRMATGLADLALRRWAFDGGQLQTATVALVDQGTVTLRTQAAETSLSRAANALLGSGRSASSALPVSLLSSTPETDWSFVSGPVGAVVRAPSGRFSAMWTRVDDPGDERTPGEVAQAVTPHGAVLISCACDDSELVQQAANALALRLEQPEQVQPEAARFRELLGSASFDERQVAVLVLGRGAVVEGGGAQIVSAAGVDWTAAAPTAASSPTPTELQLPTDGGLFPPILSPPVPRVDAGRFDAGGVR